MEGDVQAATPRPSVAAVTRIALAAPAPPSSPVPGEPPAAAQFVAACRDARRDPGGSLELARRLRDEATASGDQIALGRALTLVGVCHVARNDFVAALRALLEALSLLEDAPDVDRARALSEAGYVEGSLGDRAAAVERLSEALRLFEAAADVAGRADTLNRIGVTFFASGDLDQAETAYRRSLELRTADETLAIAGLQNNLAKVFTTRGDHDAALIALGEARARFEAEGEARGVGMVLHNLAVLESDRGEVSAAVELLRGSIALYDASGHVHGACEARTRLAVALGAGGEVDAAIARADRAHADAESRGLAAECARAAEALADLHEQRGDAAAALGWLRHLRDVEQRIFDEVSDQRLRSLQVRFQLERFQHDSVTDALTGLCNRRGLEAAFADRIADARRRGADLAVLLLDLDDFKRINDDFSHATGDEVLRTVAQILRRATRPTDVCARYGGEEFCLVLPGCDAAAARRTADELVERVRAHPWSTVAPGLVVTTSIGIATSAEVGDPRGLVDAADRALYAAKHEGKDRARHLG